MISTKEELRQLIRNGNDTQNNTLVLTIDGTFEFRDRSGRLPSDEDNDVVARNETFMAGNEYVGEAAANDSTFIDPLYASMLEAWLTYRQTGETNIYVDTFTTQREEDLIRQINALDNQ